VFASVLEPVDPGSSGKNVYLHLIRTNPEVVVSVQIAVNQHVKAGLTTLTIVPILLLKARRGMRSKADYVK